jgi:hypothetical protein
MLHDGRLTEKMISKDDFDEIEAIAKANDYGEVLDPVYYYQNARTIRIPDDQLFIYRVSIPITGPDKYFLYSIDSLCIPMNETETIRVKVPSKIAIHRQNNNIFIASMCLHDDLQVDESSRILICNPIHLVTEKERVCINAILSRTRIMIDCGAKVEIHADNRVIIERAGSNAYYLSVFKGFHTDLYCQDKTPRRIPFEKGVWKIVLNGRCQLTVDSVKLRSIVLLSSTMNKLVQGDVIIPALSLLKMYRQSIEKGEIYKHDMKIDSSLQKLKALGMLPELQLNVLQTQKPLSEPELYQDYDIPWI